MRPLVHVTCAHAPHLQFAPAPRPATRAACFQQNHPAPIPLVVGGHCRRREARLHAAQPMPHASKLWHTQGTHTQGRPQSACCCSSTRRWAHQTHVHSKQCCAKSGYVQVALTGPCQTLN
jgi:hypothetical protein